MSLSDADGPASGSVRMLGMAVGFAGLILSSASPCAGGDAVRDSPPEATAEERKDTTAPTDAAGLAAGALSWCNGVDAFVDAAGFERNALMDRNIFLSRFSERNGCQVDRWPSQQRR